MANDDPFAPELLRRQRGLLNILTPHVDDKNDVAIVLAILTTIFVLACFGVGWCWLKAKRRAAAAQYQMISKALEAEEEEFSMKFHTDVTDALFTISGDDELNYDLDEIRQMKAVEDYKKGVLTEEREHSGDNGDRSPKQGKAGVEEPSSNGHSTIHEESKTDTRLSP